MRVDICVARPSQVLVCRRSAQLVGRLRMTERRNPKRQIAHTFLVS